MISPDICRLLLLSEEEDDATSALAAPKPEPDVQKVMNGSTSQEVVLSFTLAWSYMFKNDYFFASNFLFI